MNRRALIKFIKKNGYKYEGVYHRFEQNNSGVFIKVKIDKIIVFSSDISEFHIVKRKNSYIIHDLLRGGTFSKETDVVEFMDKCDIEQFEWIDYQTNMNRRDYEEEK